MGESTRIYCRQCGQPMQGSDRFCSRCGHSREPGHISAGMQHQMVTPTAASNQTVPAPPASFRTASSVPAGQMHTNRRSRRKVWVLLGACAAILILIMLLAAAMQPAPYRLSIGQNRSVASQTIPAGGGHIAVDQDDDLGGLVLEIPPEAYAVSQTFDIQAATISQHDYGALFQPASPLITIDNGHRIAQVPMILTIPIRLAEDEFAMAFYYDRLTGQLEGIPCVSQDSQSITIATQHFSSIVVSKVKKSLLDGRILEDDVITDFLPGMSDFAAANHGSFAEQGGHCTGQVLAMIHYYNSNSNDNSSGRSLRTESRVDNCLLPDTPTFWQDDALAFRFCSLLQNKFIWDNTNQSEIRNQTEEIVYYSCAYAIALTNSPQIIVIYGKDQQGTEAGHALVVYAVSPAGLAVADPNMPGSLTRVVERDSGQNGRHQVQLNDYFSGVNTTDPGMYFSSFTYFGTYALFDFQAIDDLWQEVLAGRDVASQLFPADPVFLILSGRDDQGGPLVTSLQQLQSISSEQAALANPAAAHTLMVSVTAADPKMRLTFYRGTVQVGQPLDGPGQDTARWFSWPLQPGANDIGILYERLCDDGMHRFVHFYRYPVFYGNPPSPTITAEATETAETTGEPENLPETPFAGRWEFSRFEVTGVSGGTDAFWKDILFNGVSKQQWAYRYIGNFNDYLAHSDSHGPTVTFMSEIRIGLPIPPYSSQFASKYFFQTNYVSYHDQYPLIDGKQYRYRFSTIPAEMLDERTLHAVGYDGTGGLDDNDMHLDLTVTLTDSKTAEGSGVVTMDMATAGRISVSFKCAMVKKSQRSQLRPEFDSP